jgi:hypothetical protein
VHLFCFFCRLRKLDIAFLVVGLCICLDFVELFWFSSGEGTVRLYLGLMFLLITL